MPILCLSPTPLAATRATRRMCDAQGGIHFGPAATTLSRLVPGVLAASGDRRPVLTPLAERLLVLEAGDAAGGALAGLPPDGGLAAALARTLGELRRGEVTADELLEASRTLEGAPRLRLEVLAAVLRAYASRLAELDVLDGPGAARVAAEAVRRGSWPDRSGLDLLVVDGISAVSPAEWDLLAALVGRARRTRVSIPYFPDRPDLSSPAEPLLRRLESLHEVARVRDVEVVLPRLDEGRAPRVAALLSAFSGGPADRLPDGDGLVLAAPGAGAAGEAEAAAEAAQLLLERGFSPEDVVLVAQSPRRAAAALRAAFGARGLPLATGRGPAAAEVPVIQLVREALAAAGRLDRTAAARLCGSGWIAPGGIPGLAGLLERAGAIDGRGPAAEALRRRARSLDGRGTGRERRRLLEAAAQLEQVEAALAPLARSGPAQAHARHLSALVGRLGLRRRAARGPLDVAARDLEALSCLEDAAEEVVRSASLAGRGAAALAPAWFGALLALALESSALSSPAEPAAGAVELLGPDEVAGGPVRGAILVGCAEQDFPAPAPPEPLLREPERAALDRHLRRAAVPTAGARRAQAVHRAFVSAAAGAEAVAFAWAAPGPAGDGGPPAPLVVEALTAAGVEVPEAVPGEPPLPAARTARAALRAAVRLGAPGARALEGTPLGARALDALARGEADGARRAAVLAGEGGAFAGAVEGAALAALREALPAEWTPSQLETHARCPFRAYLRLALRLPDAGEPDLDMEIRDEGTLLHALLERFVSGRVARGAWPPAGAPGDLAEARAAAEEVLRRFEREGRTGDPATWAGRREVVLHRLDRIVLAEARDHGGLTPRLLEHAFGGDAPAPPLELFAGGETVRLRGRIDRVDASPERLLVIDYKNSRGTDDHEAALDPEGFGVGSFQVPAYLMAAARALPGRKLEATFALLRRATRLDPVALDPGDPRLAAAAPAGGGPSFAAAVVERVGRMRAGRFPVVSQGCERCPYGAVCRFEGLAARAAEEAR